MIQFEVMKSFDFNSVFQQSIKEQEGIPIHLAMECADIEIPVVFNSILSEVDKEQIEDALNINSSAAVTLDTPYISTIQQINTKPAVSSEGEKAPIVTEDASIKKIQKKGKKDPDTGDSEGGNTISASSIGVEIANPEMKLDQNFDSSFLGKIKITIRPITN